MTKKNKDTTHILRFIAMSLMFAVMMSAGAIGCVNGGGGGGGGGCDCGDGCGCCCDCGDCECEHGCGCCCGCCDCGQPGIEVSKTVWNPISEEWVEEITANVGDIVRFNCTIHNNGTIYDGDCCNCNGDCCNDGGCCNCNCNCCNNGGCCDCCNCYNLTNITVLDVLPDGLVYVINSATSSPTYTSMDNRTVKWEFLGRTLEPCDSITIEFNVSVIKCGESVNRVNASAWYDEVQVSDKDAATVTVVCTSPAPDIKVNKTVWNGTAWVNSTSADVNDTVRFNCTIHNNGECNLTNITVWDMLPESLEYANDATHAPTYISTDNRTVMWAFPDLTLEPCDSITIEFNVSVVGCGESVNRVSASAWYDEVQVSDEDIATVTVVCPSTPPPHHAVPALTSIGVTVLIGLLAFIGAGAIMRRR